MLQLYKSNHFALTEVRTSGKKCTGGILCFEGMKSILGSEQEITAIEDGIVLRAGRCVQSNSREHKIGAYICVSGRNGVQVTYGRLACRFVRSGDYVRTGDIIGIQGSSGSGRGEYLTLEFRRNGRRVDGCDYLGIAHQPQEFLPRITDPAQLVANVCSLDDNMRSYIDGSPSADEIWRKLLAHISEHESAGSSANSNAVYD